MTVTMQMLPRLERSRSYLCNDALFVCGGWKKIEPNRFLKCKRKKKRKQGKNEEEKDPEEEEEEEE